MSARLPQKRWSPAGRHPNWWFAERVLAGVLPGSRGFMPSDITGLSPDSWEPFDIERRDSSVIEQALLRYCDGVLSGPLVVVTDASWAAHVGPFFVSTEDLPTLVADHADRYDELFVSTDLVLVAPAVGRVVVVHHNGLIATLHGRVVDPLSDGRNSDSIILTLTPAEARELVRAIYLLGEHIAAGAPIPDLGDEFNEAVGAVYKRLLLATGGY